MAHDSHGHVSAEHEYVNPPSGSGHEHTDASVGLIVRFAVWLAVSAIVVHVLGWVMFYVLVERRMPVAAPEFPLAVEQAPRLPAEPRLQAYPPNDLTRFRREERAILDSYGWVDRDAGAVRIPIDEAMRLTVERGLPVRAEEETPGLMPTDASAGRLMERRRQ
jgi:hypothetical protein